MWSVRRLNKFSIVILSVVKTSPTLGMALQARADGGLLRALKVFWASAGFWRGSVGIGLSLGFGHWALDIGLSLGIGHWALGIGPTRVLPVCVGRVVLAGIPVSCFGSLGESGDFCMMWSAAMVGVQPRNKEGEASRRSQLVAAYRTSCSFNALTVFLTISFEVAFSLKRVYYLTKKSKPPLRREYRNPN